MRRLPIATLIMLVTACGDDGAATNDAGIDGRPIDAPTIMPVLTSFTATPQQIPANTPTLVTWNWTYLDNPTIPVPVCTIDHGVGTVMPGDQTMLTLTASTTYLISCTNSGGTAMRAVAVTIPTLAPTIATFTATPSTILPNQAQSVTFAWTFTGTPSPPPTCTVDAGAGMVTNGTAVMVNQPGSRIYRLRCANGVGAATTRDVTVNVDECSTGTHDCQLNATCTDTQEAFTCACSAGFVGDGDRCSSTLATCAGATCDAAATCQLVNGTTPACVCNNGFVGTGGPGNCQRLRLAFTTSTSGNGNLSTWATGTGTGLARADSICQAAATAGNLPGTYVAWMSDSTHDAYCRVLGLTGKKANNCNQGAPPAPDAGPWVRTNDLEPHAPTLDKLLMPTRAIYRPASFTESGAVELGITERIYTGTDDNGVYANNACTDWTSNGSGVQGAMGEVHGGGVTWTDRSGITDPNCDTIGRLRCLQTTGGPALPTRHPTSKRVFLSSVSGTGNLSSWADAGGLTGMAAGDAVCQARARYAGYTNHASFKAMISGTSSFTSRFLGSSGPWVRPDGIVVFTTETALFTTLQRLLSAISQTETKQYIHGTVDGGSTWTGMTSTGGTGTNCTSWTSTTSTGYSGRHDLMSTAYTQASTSTACAEINRLMCVQD